MDRNVSFIFKVTLGRSQCMAGTTIFMEVLSFDNFPLPSSIPHSCYKSVSHIYIFLFYDTLLLTRAVCVITGLEVAIAAWWVHYWTHN